MEQILKDSATGKILLDSQGRVLKNRPFNEMPIQDGLVFWGQADPAYLTIVDDLVSEAHDVRGNGLKMVQATVANRPNVTSNSISFYGYGKKLTFSGAPVSAFIVIKPNTVVGNNIGLGTARENYLGERQGRVGHIKVSVAFWYYYGNNAKINTLIPFSASYKILHTIDDNFSYSGIITLGTNYNEALSDVEVKEWGWYNRVLTEQEVIYNINALNAKHQIF